jgi:hypothetical protein
MGPFLAEASLPVLSGEAMIPAADGSSEETFTLRAH